MTIICAKPRQRSFIAFRTGEEALTWCKKHITKVIDIRRSHGRIIVNHWVR